MSKRGIFYNAPFNCSSKVSKFLYTCTVIFLAFWILSSVYLKPVPSYNEATQRRFFYPTSNPTRIPSIIHQSWKTNDVPERYKRWIQSWKELHPSWKYILWTDRTNRKLVLRQFPWLIDIYDRLPVNIARADMARFLYMYTYGGVYVDLDFRALRPFDTLIQNKCVILGTMESDLHRDDAIPNAIMASVPGHPFWLLCVRKVIDRHFLGFRGTETNFSGSLVLKEAYQLWHRIHNDPEFEDGSITPDDNREGRKSVSDSYEFFPCQQVQLEPKGVLYPYSWVWEPKEIKQVCDFSKESASPDEDLCMKKVLERYPDAYSITFWTHSWSAKGSLCEKRPSLCKDATKVQ